MIEKIANSLGLELEEEFKLGGTPLKYKFTKECLMCQDMMNFKLWRISVLMINDMLKLTVVKLPWKPKIGDRYYTIILDSWGIRVSSLKYDDGPHDARLANLNIMFKTEEEAQAKLEELKGFLKV